MNRITRACMHLQSARRTDRVSLRRTRSHLTTSSHRDSQTYDLRTDVVASYHANGHSVFFYGSC
jgi:hypothetical protein